MQAKTQKTKTEEIQTTFQTKEIEAFQIINSSIKLGEQASWSVGKRSIIQDSIINVAKGSKLIIGEEARLQGVNITVRRPGATVKIGKLFTMYGSRIICDQSIEIGNNVWVGSYCLITDSQIHALDKLERRQEALLLRQNRWQPPKVKTIPLVIEDDCFLGDGVKILYPSGGANLEKMLIASGTVVGANAVVKSPVLESGNILAKVPARIIGSVVKVN